VTEQLAAQGFRDDSVLSMDDLDQVVGGLARPWMEEELAPGGPVGGAGLVHRDDTPPLTSSRGEYGE
jgi:hypothetical protein